MTWRPRAARTSAAPSTPEVAALPAVAPALASAGQQRNEPAQAQRAVRAAQRASRRPHRRSWTVANSLRQKKGGDKFYWPGPHWGTSGTVRKKMSPGLGYVSHVYYAVFSILWVTTQTQLFLIAPPPKNFFFPSQGSGLSSLGRIMLKSQGLCGGGGGVPLFLPKRWQIFPTGCSMIFDCPVDRSWYAQRCCDGAATESLLRRSCDGVAAATELRRPAPSRSFCASRLDATR